MNVIFILCDTMVREKLSPWHGGTGRYGHVQTPNMERIAARGVRFDNHWINSAPCMPARRDLSSGRMEFPWRSWGPRESFDADWAQTLRATEVATALFTDHANLFDVGSGNYHHWFDEYHFVRGHLNDHCRAVLPTVPGRAGQMAALYAGGERIERPEDAFCARNLGNVATWLDEHHADGAPFFLCVDEFDPHWPLDPPEPYRSMYLDDKSLATRDDMPTLYRSMRAVDHSAEELAWLNAQADGKITLVDRWLGDVLDRLDRYDLWDDTLLILTTDHGEYIGEYGQCSKGGGPSYPMFARIPLLIADPRAALPAGTNTAALSCTVDLHATVLDALGVTPAPSCHGRSLLPILRDGATAVRDEVLYGWWGSGFYWTDGHHLACKAPVAPGPLYQYGTDFGEKYVGLRGAPFDRYANAETGRYLPHTDRPVYRVPADGLAYNAHTKDRDALYDLTTDPDCHQNLAHPDSPAWTLAQQKLLAAMHALHVPAEHAERLGL